LEKNGKGREYDIFNKIIFEGEYSNGKRVLKRKKNFKEFNDGYLYKYDKFKRLIFEGEFINGEKNGKGIEYFTNGDIEFEGEYKNDKRHGKGKEYHYNLKLKFEGEYKYGKKWDGVEYRLNGDVVNKYQDGKGFIKEYNNYNNLIFEGEYLNGERNGKGKEYIFDNGEIIEFEGEFLNGKKSGKGKEYLDNKLIFEGEYLYIMLNRNIIIEKKEEK